MFVSNVQVAAPRGGVFSRYQKCREALSLSLISLGALRGDGEETIACLWAEIQELTQAQRQRVLVFGVWAVDLDLQLVAGKGSVAPLPWQLSARDKLWRELQSTHKVPQE